MEADGDRHSRRAQPLGEGEGLIAEPGSKPAIAM
jgi:hypothetical protein